MATNGTVGSVDELWRFPVKSMGGEPLQQANLTERGLVSDRVALINTDTGKVVSAKSVSAQPMRAYREPPAGTPPRAPGRGPRRQAQQPGGHKRRTAPDNSPRPDTRIEGTGRHRERRQNGRPAPAPADRRHAPPQAPHRRPGPRQRRSAEGRSTKKPDCGRGGARYDGSGQLNMQPTASGDNAAQRPQAPNPAQAQRGTHRRGTPGQPGLNCPYQNSDFTRININGPGGSSDWKAFMLG